MNGGMEKLSYFKEAVEEFLNKIRKALTELDISQVNGLLNTLVLAKSRGKKYWSLGLAEADSLEKLLLCVSCTWGLMCTC